MKELSKQEIESIEAAADAIFPESRCKELGYIAGATEQAIKAKELVEALETIRNWFPEKSDVAKVCKEALLNYKP